MRKLAFLLLFGTGFFVARTSAQIVNGPPYSTQGPYISWNNLTGSTGETDFVNNQGGGSGGFAFMNTPSSGSPQTTLMFLDGGGHLQMNSNYSTNPSITIGNRDSSPDSGSYSLLFGAFRDIESVSSGIVATPTWTCCNGYPASGYPGIRVNSLGFYPIYDPANPSMWAPSMMIAGTGNVGIGTSSPSALLEINGSIKLSANSGASMTFPDASVQSTAWNGVLSGGDYAESVNVSGDRAGYVPGDVLVIDSSSEGRFLKSSAPYSTTVSGIYSTKPGVVGRRQATAREHMADEVPMAMTGIVPTKVSTENGPIRPGDLLVTSSTPGYAMKGTDHLQMLGAVIGKALGNLNSGLGIIEAVVTLQ